MRSRNSSKALGGRTAANSGRARMRLSRPDATADAGAGGSENDSNCCATCWSQALAGWLPPSLGASCRSERSGSAEIREGRCGVATSQAAGKPASTGRAPSESRSDASCRKWAASPGGSSGAADKQADAAIKSAWQKRSGFIRSRDDGRQVACSRDVRSVRIEHKLQVEGLLTNAQVVIENRSCDQENGTHQSSSNTTAHLCQRGPEPKRGGISQ